YIGSDATWDTGRARPTIAVRVDMDALDIHESDDVDHYPKKEGFRSKVPHKMHACGHDAHTAMGLGLATMIAKSGKDFNGVIKLIFQQSGAGNSGCKSVVEADVVKGV